MADFSKLTKRELIMTLYARDLMLENERKRLECLTEKYFELKQQLHDLPKKIVEEIRDNMSKIIIEKQIKWGDNIQIGFICNAINECLDTILEKFGAEDESNND